MKNNLFSCALLSAAFFVSTECYSQNFCEIMSEVSSQAERQFRRYRGAIDENGDYVSKLTLPGADHCYIVKSDPEFVCVWKVSPNETISQTQNFVNGVRACFPGGKLRDRTNSERPAFAYSANEVQYSIHGNPKRGRIFLGVERDD